MSQDQLFLDALTRECAAALYGDAARHMSREMYQGLRAKVERALRRALAAVDRPLTQTGETS